MMDVSYPVIEIGQTRTLGECDGRNLEDIKEIDLLFDNFIVDVSLSPQGYVFKVDAFRLLYELISELYCLQESRDFILDVGEGLMIRGEFNRTEDAFSISLSEKLSNTPKFKMTKSQLLVYFSIIISDLVRSISCQKIDVFQCLKKFPPALF